MDQAKKELIRADFKKELKIIKGVYKRLDSLLHPSADELMNAARASSHVTSILNILYNDAIASMATPAPETDNTSKAVDVEELCGVLRYLKNEYQTKLQRVTVTQLELTDHSNFNEMAKAYGDNVLFDLSSDHLLFMSLVIPEKYTVSVASLRILFYANPTVWGNPGNTVFEIITHTGTVVACTANDIPPTWQEMINDTLLAGKICTGKPEYVKPEPKEHDPLDMLVHLDNSFNDSTLRKVTSLATDCNRLIPYFLDVFSYKNLNSMRAAIGNAKSLRHTHDGIEYLFVSIEVDTEQAEHGYNLAHVLYRTDSSFAHEAIFELVNDTDKSLVRIAGNKAVTRRQYLALTNLVNNGSLKTYPLSKLPEASDLPDLRGCEFERITNNEDLSEYVTRLPSGTLTIDPRVVDLLGDLTSQSQSILANLNKYLLNFIPVIASKHLGVPHGLFRHSALRDSEKHHAGKIADFYVRNDNSYADMVLRMPATTESFTSDDRNDDRDWTNMVTLTWHGTVAPNGRIQFPIDDHTVSKLFFTFHTRDIPQGTPVRVTEATYYELVELMDALHEQFRQWDLIGSKPLVKPITVSATEVYESSMPSDARFPERAAIEAIVDGTLGLKDIIPKK